MKCWEELSVVFQVSNHSRRRLCKRNSRVLGHSGLELPDNLGCRVRPCLSWSGHFDKQTDVTKGPWAECGPAL